MPVTLFLLKQNFFQIYILHVHFIVKGQLIQTYLKFKKVFKDRNVNLNVRVRKTI